MSVEHSEALMLNAITRSYLTAILNALSLSISKSRERESSESGDGERVHFKVQFWNFLIFFQHFVVELAPCNFRLVTNHRFGGCTLLITCTAVQLHRQSGVT